MWPTSGWEEDDDVPRPAAPGSGWTPRHGTSVRDGAIREHQPFNGLKETPLLTLNGLKMVSSRYYLLEY